MTARLCKDCKYLNADRGCDHPNNSAGPDYVKGGTIRNYMMAQTVRMDPKYCGPEGAWFSPHPDAVDQEPPDQYNRAADAESQL